MVWLLRRAGLDPALYRASPLQRRLPACLRALRAKSTDTARSLVQQQPQLLDAAIDALLIGVTEFFRDPEIFDSLRLLLPSLAKKDRPLRIWSVSCSVGCELYSVAIMLSELGLLRGCRLLGTDCRADALGMAQRGSYAESYLRRIIPSLRDVYFEYDGSALQIREPLRSQTQWRQENVFETSDTEAWDVILWRNTAIYMKAAAARSVWDRLAQSLRPGGLLVTGKAERPDCGVPLKRLAACIYTNPAEQACAPVPRF